MVAVVPLSDYSLVLCHLHQAHHFWNPDSTQAHLPVGLFEAYCRMQTYWIQLACLWHVFSNTLALRQWSAEKVRLPQSYTEAAYSSKYMVRDLKSHLNFFLGLVQECAWSFLRDIPSWWPRHSGKCYTGWSCCKKLHLKRVKENIAPLVIIGIAWQRVIKT